jgi:hypothetical protein
MKINDKNMKYAWNKSSNILLLNELKVMKGLTSIYTPLGT